VLLSEQTALALQIYSVAFFHVKTYLRSARPIGRAFSFVLAGRPRLNIPMPDLTRRRSADRCDSWLIYYGDVQAGIIAMRAGNPPDTDPWEWSCGFYPRGRGPAKSSPTHRRPSTNPRRIRVRLGGLSGEPHPTPIFRRGVTNGSRPHMPCRIAAANSRRNCRPADQNAF
jgi:hypothetical protein